MKDIFGNIIDVGDEVAFCNKSSNWLFTGTVIEAENPRKNQILIEYYFCSDIPEYIFISSHSCVKNTNSKS